MYPSLLVLPQEGLRDRDCCGTQRLNDQHVFNVSLAADMITGMDVLSRLHQIDVRPNLVNILHLSRLLFGHSENVEGFRLQVEGSSSSSSSSSTFYCTC
jgi:hypothetical protein